jgi:hypothetical protein
MAIANVHSRYENGQLIYYESGQMQRIVDAVGPNVIKYINDFGGDNPADTWVDTVVSAGSGTSAMTGRSEAGGAVQIRAAGNDNDGVQIQKLLGFVATSNDPIYFGCRWEFTGCGAGSCDVIIGLVDQDTSVIAGATDMIAFRTKDADTALDLVTEDNTSETELELASSISVDTWYTNEFYFDGNATTPRVYAWHNGTLIGNSTAGIEQTNGLAVTIAYLNGAAHGEGNAGINVDYVRCVQLLAAR